MYIMCSPILIVSQSLCYKLFFFLSRNGLNHLIIKTLLHTSSAANKKNYYTIIFVKIQGDILVWIFDCTIIFAIIWPGLWSQQNDFGMTANYLFSLSYDMCYTDSFQSRILSFFGKINFFKVGVKSLFWWLKCSFSICLSPQDVF